MPYCLLALVKGYDEKNCGTCRFVMPYSTPMCCLYKQKLGFTTGMVNNQMTQTCIRCEHCIEAEKQEMREASAD